MRNDPAGPLLQDIFAVLAHFHLRRHARGQLHHLMIQERHAGLQPPGHGHIVHALDRVIDQHDLAVDPERLVDRPLRPGLGEMLRHECRGMIGFGKAGLQQLAHLVLIPVEEHAGIVG